MNDVMKLTTKVGWGSWRTGLLIGASLLAVGLALGLDPATTPALGLLPIAMVLLFACLTRRTLESLVVGCLFGFLILEEQRALLGLSEALLGVLSDPTIAWVIMVTGLIGSLIALIGLSGGVLAFGRFASRFVRGRRSTLVTAWLMGCIIYVDDYLNTLAVGSSMRRLCDKYRVSRQMLAYVVDSTAAPMCLLIPLSTWGVYVVGLLEVNAVAEAGEGFRAYLAMLPYLLYPLVAILLVPLVAMGVIPLLGPMRRAEALARRGEGRCVEDYLDRQAVRGTPRLVNFLVPLLSLLVFTLYLGIDTYNGAVAALAITFAFYGLQRLPLGGMFDTALKGFESMLLPMAIVVLSFVLQEANSQLGLTEYVIETFAPLLSAQLLPLVTFILLGGVAFGSGSFWGTMAIAFPIFLPLAEALDAETLLVAGAIVSAGAFGSHACFYGDATVLSAKGAGTTPMDHALTQLPYVLIAATLSAIGFYLLA